MLVHAVFILKFIYISPDIPGKKKKHSSRMRTARLTMLGCPGSVSRRCVSRGCRGVSREVCVQGCMSRELFKGSPRNVCSGVCLGAVWGVRGCVSRGCQGCQGGVQGCGSRGVFPGGVFRGVSRGGTSQDP